VRGVARPGRTICAHHLYSPAGAPPPPLASRPSLHMVHIHGVVVLAAVLIRSTGQRTEPADKHTH
jgi:hypothetical protein